MKIILDCFGGDTCPGSAIDGAILALCEDKDLKITLCGDESVIKAYLADKSYDSERIDFLHAGEVVTNDDKPAMAVRRKKDSSMMKGLSALADGGYDGFVSSGNTGALLVGATLIVKLVDGVQRASLSPLLPTVVDGRTTILVDGGANVDCKASMLREFAIMGSAYMQSVLNIPAPKVGLLNNGVEEEKGNEVTKEAHALLKECDVNFVGNVEARDMFSGVVDVIVADGFIGNAAMKAAEGMGNSIFALLKNYITGGGLKMKIGYLLLKPAFKRLKGLMTSDAVGGGVFLGVKKVVVKAHGASSPTAFKNAIVKANDMAKADVCNKIAAALATKEEQ